MSFLLNPFEKLINKALHFDAGASQQLQHLAGKQFSIVFTDLPIKIYGTFLSKGIKLFSSAPSPSDVDVTIRAPSFVFAGLALSKNLHAATQKGLIVEGNLEAAQAIQTFFLNLNIDWEEALASFTHDSFAFGFFKFLSKAKKKKQAFTESIAHSTHDFLIEESRLLPHSLEVSAFIKEVDRFRSEVDRCEARFNHLVQTGKFKEHL
jgi:ubiquinone biosynthesis protein UbiJ